MIEWVFVLVALTPTGATAGSVGFRDKETCIAYAQGRTANVHVVDTAKCVGLRTGEILDFKK